MASDQVDQSSGRFDIAALVKSLPETAETMLADIYLTDRPTASARIFRVYRPVPAHYHATCDEFLYVLSGHGRFWMGNAADEADFGPDQLLVFDRGTVHCIPRIDEHPLTVLAIDTPRRAPTDVHFIDATVNSASTFMARNNP